MSRIGRTIATLLVVLTFTSFLPGLFRVSAGVPTWSSPTLIDGNTSIDLLPSGVTASNGTMWLAWQTNRYRGDSMYDIAYKTFTAGVWSPVRQFSAAGWSNAPSMTQLVNGSIALFWAYKSASPGSYQIFYKLYNSPAGWSNSYQATTTTLNDTNPAVAVNRNDGTLWLAWTRNNSTCTGSCTDPWKQVYYKSLKNNVWSAETRMTTDTNQNLLSGIMVGKDGLTRIVWSKGLGSQSNYQVFYKTYNATSRVWSAETKIVTSSNSDEHPSIMQDRNGTFWLFWGRRININVNTFQYNIWTQYSYTGGSSWAGTKQLTSAAVGIDSLQPYAMQSSYDKSIYVFYTTDPNNNDDIYTLISSQITPIHDVTIVNITSSINLEYPGGRASIGQSPIIQLTVTVLNNGDTSDIVTGSLTISNATTYNLGTKQNLPAPGGTATLIFNWNTTGAQPGWYSTSATVGLAAGLETAQNQFDNKFQGMHTMRIIPTADVDQNGKVDIVDLGIFYYDFGASFGQPLYNPLCDIGNTGTIDIVDIGVVTSQFGTNG